MTFDPHGDIPTLAVLCPPVVDYPYFQGCEADFEPDAREYSPANAWWLAEASFLAYGDVDLLTARFAGDTLLRRSGLQFELIGDNGTTPAFSRNN
jgi:hypothetical protein